MWRGWRFLGRVRAQPRRPGAWPLLPAALVAGSVFSSVPSLAAEPAAPAASWQVWSGADVSENIWLVYTGVTVSPWSVMHEPGWKMRVAGGFGEYRYEKAPERDPDPDHPRPRDFQARTYFADVLVGYLMRWGELTAKAFAGATSISHAIEPGDDATVVFGDEIGVKGALELWLNMGERGWGSLDMSWATAHETRAARARVGYRVWRNLSLGLEAGLNVNAQGLCRMKGPDAPSCKNHYGDGEVVRSEILDYARTGVFARYEGGRGELSVSAGVLGDAFSQDNDIEIAPYVTVNWLMQF